MKSALVILGLAAGAFAQLDCGGPKNCPNNHDVVGDQSVIVAGADNTIGWSMNDGAPFDEGIARGAMDAKANNAGILAGFNNEISRESDRSGILAGADNLIHDGATNAGIVCGSGNRASGNRAVVGGGNNNDVRGPNSGVLAGNDNEVSGPRSAIVAGDNIDVTGANSAAVAGFTQVVSGDRAFLGAGEGNEVIGHDSAIVAGIFNQATAPHSTVVGGDRNKAQGINSAVLGGSYNVVNGPNSGVVVGENNVVADTANNALIGGGLNNFIAVDATNAFIAAGKSNRADGINSAVIGAHGKAEADGSIVISAAYDDNGIECVNSKENSIQMCAEYGVRVYGGIKVDGVDLLQAIWGLQQEIKKLKGNNYGSHGNNNRPHRPVYGNQNSYRRAVDVAALASIVG